MGTEIVTCMVKRNPNFFRYEILFFLSVCIFVQKKNKKFYYMGTEILIGGVFIKCLSPMLIWTVWNTVKNVSWFCEEGWFIWFIELFISMVL